MNKCFVTKVKGVVPNDMEHNPLLHKLDEVVIPITIHGTGDRVSCLALYPKDIQAEFLSGRKGYVSDGVSNSMWISNSVDGDKDYLKIHPYYDVNAIKCGASSKSHPQISFELKEIVKFTNLTMLALNDMTITDDISSLSTLTNLTSLSLWNTNVKGDISSLSTLTNLTSLSLGFTRVKGDISNLIDKLTKLKTLFIPPSVTITDAQKTTLTDRGCTITITQY